MTNKELQKILKRFDKRATVVINNATVDKIYATVNQDGQWTIHLKAEPNEANVMPQTSPIKNEKSLDKEN